MSWTVCYTDSYQIHKNKKDESEWYPQKPRHRRITIMKRTSINHNNPRYRYQKDNNEETENQTLIGDEPIEELSETNTNI